MIFRKRHYFAHPMPYRIVGDLEEKEVVRLYAQHFLSENKGQLTQERAEELAQEFVKHHPWGIATDDEGGISAAFPHHDEGEWCCCIGGNRR